MTIYYKASLIIVLFLAMAACSVASHHHGGVRGAANNNTDQHHHHHRDHHHHHHHHDIHKDTDAVGVHTKDRFLGSISCENTVETLLVIDGDGPDDVRSARRRTLSFNCKSVTFYSCTNRTIVENTF